MTCRRCQRQFDGEEGGTCPFCGETNLSLDSGVLKTSTILISAGETEAVYRSIKEVPDRLRRRLLRSTSGLNSGTILIADRRGREELAKAIRKLPAHLQRNWLQSVFSSQVETGMIGLAGSRLRKTAFGLILLAMIAAVAWIIGTRW